MMCSKHLDESATRVKSCMIVTSLCTFSSSWTVCLTDWITDARHTVLEASLLIASTRNETVPLL
jgi:hypothetical protein